MANNHYSLKDKKLSVWEYTTTTSYGTTVKKYVKKYSKIWAYYRHNGGNATLTGSALKVYDENAAALFIINKREIKIGWLIVFNHKIYEITRIDDYEGYADDLKIYCKLATSQTFSNGLADD